MAAVIDQLVVGREHQVGQPVVAHELPDILDRVEFGRAWRKGHDGDVAGHLELCGSVPSGLIHDENRMGVGRNGLGYLGKVQAHGSGVAVGQDQACALAVARTDCAEDVG
jgi:hypothetical protein